MSLLQGDWCTLVAKDAELLGIILDEIEIKSMSKNKFKHLVKEKVQRASLKFLNDLKKTHSKVQNIKYSKLSTQDYINSELFTDIELQVLFSLRSKMSPVKCYFPGMHSDKKCTQGCTINEDQAHLLSCIHLVNKMADKSLLAEAEYDDLFGSVDQQKQITDIYIELLQIKENILSQ